MLHVGGEQFSLFFQVFLVLIDSKRWQFCVLINARSNVHIFRVTKSFSSSIDLILGPLYSSFSKNRNFLISLSVILDSLCIQDIGNMCHYAGRIRILWLLLPGAVPSFLRRPSPTVKKLKKKLAYIFTL